jgi:hypothetical protein
MGRASTEEITVIEPTLVDILHAICATGTVGIRRQLRR